MALPDLPEELTGKSKIMMARMAPGAAQSKAAPQARMAAQPKMAMKAGGKVRGCGIAKRGKSRGAVR